MQNKRQKGIVLKKTPFGECDEIITIYTAELGKLRVLAKAVKKPTSKLSFALGLLSEVSFDLHGKSNLKNLASVEQLKSFEAESLGKLQAGYFFSECFLRSVPDEEPNLDLYNLSKDFLEVVQSLSSDLETDKASVLFLILFLKNLGLDMKNLKLSSDFSVSYMLSEKEKNLVLSFEEQNFQNIKISIDPGQLKLLKEKLVFFLENFVERKINSGRMFDSLNFSGVVY